MFNPGTYQRTPLQIALRRRKQAVNSIEVHRRGIANLEARIMELTAEIEALGGEPKPRTPRIDFRSKGELQRTMFDMLREHGEVTAKDLAAHMIETYGLDANDPKIVHAVRQRASQCLARNQRAGRIHEIGWSASAKGRRARGRFKRFALAACRRNFPGLGPCPRLYFGIARESRHAKQNGRHPKVTPEHVTGWPSS